MTWALHRWIWQLDGPLYVGAPPAGSLNRARLYVPARTLWGAVTAELARLEGADHEMPKYETVGTEVLEQTRCTYLYPAERCESEWHAWLPEYREGKGLVLHPEPGVHRASAAQTERRFRSRLLSIRPGTAIDPSNDAADEGSLRETECIQTRWRQNGGSVGSPVVMVGFVFTKDENFRRRLERIGTLFLGGDTRYGLGRVDRVAFEPAEQLFGLQVDRRSTTLRVRSSRALAHADAPSLRGDMECLGGWDYQKLGKIRRIVGPLWTPGSVTVAGDIVSWDLRKDGIWQIAGASSE